MDEVIKGVMETLDRPENASVARSITKEIHGVTSWHKQIDDLAEELGTAITEDSDHIAKLDKIGKMAEDFNIYN